VNPENLQLLDFAPWVALMPAWLLVLFRLTGIFLFTPLFSSRVIPGNVKIILALGLSFCIFPMLLSVGKTSSVSVMAIAASGLSLWTVVPAVIGELLTGSVIGFAATMPLIGMQLGGRIASQQMGLGLAEVFSPGAEQAGITSQFLYLLGLSIFLLLGGHRLLLEVLVGSFDHVPLGGVIAGEGVLRLVVGLFGAAFELALHVAAPLLALIFLQTLALGFIARTVPQLNILSIGFALRILAGGVTLTLVVSVISGRFIISMSSTLRELASFFGL